MRVLEVCAVFLKGNLVAEGEDDPTDDDVLRYARLVTKGLSRAFPGAKPIAEWRPGRGPLPDDFYSRVVFGDNTLADAGSREIATVKLVLFESWEHWRPYDGVGA